MAESKSDDFDSWVVAVCGTNIFIGKPTAGSDTPISNPVTVVEKNEFLLLKPVYQVQVTVIPLRDNKGNMRLQREITAMPFLVTIKEEPLWVRPDVIQVMGELKPEDRNRYKSLVDQASDLMTQLSAQEAGLTTARTMPGGNA